MRDGVCVVGEYLGVSSQPWSRGGKSGVNNRLGVGRKYLDKYGIEQMNVVEIDVSGEFLQQLNSADYTGKRVAVSVLARARVGGRDGAWLSYYAGRDAEITVLKAEK